MPRTERQPITDRELSQPALVLAQQFVQRWDLYAQQLDDGRYICVREMLNVGKLFAHLGRDITLGTYLLNEQSQARFIVLDADDDDQFAELVRLAKALNREEVRSAWRTAPQPTLKALIVRLLVHKSSCYHTELDDPAPRRV